MGKINEFLCDLLYFFLKTEPNTKEIDTVYLALDFEDWRSSSDVRIICNNTLGLDTILPSLHILEKTDRVVEAKWGTSQPGTGGARARLYRKIKGQRRFITSSDTDVCFTDAQPATC